MTERDKLQKYLDDNEYFIDSIMEFNRLLFAALDEAHEEGYEDGWNACGALEEDW